MISAIKKRLSKGGIKKIVNDPFKGYWFRKLPKVPCDNTSVTFQFVLSW
jgi:hypothetical protein